MEVQHREVAYSAHGNTENNLSLSEKQVIQLILEKITLI